MCCEKLGYQSGPMESAISNGYVVYLQESEVDLGIDNYQFHFNKSWNVMISLNGLI